MIDGQITNKDLKKELDQFYTQDAIAEKCLNMLLQFIKDARLYSDGFKALEPSAGGGAFLRALEKTNHCDYFAFDIDPHHAKVAKRNFLKDDLSAFLPDKAEIIVIGNPPFGKRARLAAEFINKAFDYTDTVAFILPLQFQKYSAQNKLIKEARLVLDENLPRDSFVFNGKKYPVGCCFQVWTKLLAGTDLRLRTSPVTKHQDFEMWQYNNTREAEKYFDKEKYQWDFAVPRQGYKDYTIKEVDPNKMDHHTQWIFFKASSPKILDRLNRIDYVKLSHKNISIPGFGKADVIAEYEKLFGNMDITTSSRKMIIDEIDVKNNNTEDTITDLPLGGYLTPVLTYNQ